MRKVVAADLVTERAPLLWFYLIMVKLPPKTRNSEDHQRDCRECHDQDNPAYYAQRLGQIQHMAESIRPSGVVRFPVRFRCLLLAAPGGSPRRSSHCRAICRPWTSVSARAVSLPCRRSWVRVPSSALEGDPPETAGFSALWRSAILRSSATWSDPLRHSFASLLNHLELPATTLARLTGHADAGFTLRVYARDSRDEAAVVKEVVGRAEAAGIGT